MYEDLVEKLIAVDEAVATEVSPEEKLRRHYENRINTKLKPSTFYGEHWIKFYMLRNGDIIPVDYAHDDTADDAGIDFLELSRFGIIAGSIRTDDKSMMLDSSKKPSEQQVAKLKQLYVEYKPKVVHIDIYDGIDRHVSKIVKSIDEFEYFITYGKDDIDEAVEASDEEKFDYFLERTNKHIGLVQAAAAAIVEAYPEEFVELTDEVEDHDASKLEEPEMTPYIAITWRHKLEKEQGEFDPIKGKGYQTPGNLEKKDEDEATLHHIRNNAHHPEYHLDDKTKANIGTNRDDSIECVDASKMLDINIAEMVADWQAMSEELQTNTAREWFDKVKDTRWHFSEEQEELIDRLLKVFEESGEVEESRKEAVYKYRSSVSNGQEIFTRREIDSWKRQGLHARANFVLDPKNTIKGYMTLEGDFIKEARNSRSKCMKCSSAPEVEVLWANGVGHAWFCMKHFKEWATKGDGKGDVDYVKKIQNGEAAKDWKSNTSPNVISSMKFL